VELIMQIIRCPDHDGVRDDHDASPGHRAAR
jgi:hypothetical protein